jgi:large subunit ribosomal protein L3
MRVGLIALKLGMSRVLTDEGLHVPLTLLMVDNCTVVSIKSLEKDGYSAVQLGSGKAKIKNISKSLRGHFANSKIEPCKKIFEFRVDNNTTLKVGDRISANHFIKNHYIDATSVSIGKGFAGVIKRHNFGGLRASHGVSISHRSHGSTGQCQDPGRVFKGKKMAGHMGFNRVTTQNLLIHFVDANKGLICLRGSVAGPKGGYVLLKDSLKK